MLKDGAPTRRCRPHHRVSTILCRALRASFLLAAFALPAEVCAKLTNPSTSGEKSSKFSNREMRELSSSLYTLLFLARDYCCVRYAILAVLLFAPLAVAGTYLTRDPTTAEVPKIVLRTDVAEAGEDGGRPVMTKKLERRSKSAARARAAKPQQKARTRAAGPAAGSAPAAGGGTDDDRTSDDDEGRRPDTRRAAPAPVPAPKPAGGGGGAGDDDDDIRAGGATPVPIPAPEPAGGGGGAGEEDDDSGGGGGGDGDD